MTEERRQFDRDDLDRERIITSLRRIVHEEVKARTSSWPKKDGDGVLGYIGRIITPERIALVVLLVYNLGGRVQQFTTSVTGLEKENAQLAARVADVSGQIYRLAEQQTATKGTLDKQDAAIAELQSRSTAINKQIQLTVTRGEFKEAIEQRIITRLDRIEKQ